MRNFLEMLKFDFHLLLLNFVIARMIQNEPQIQVSVSCDSTEQFWLLEVILLFLIRLISGGVWNPPPPS